MSNELDKHISEQLHRYESAVDAEAIWATVKPPRRRRPWLWMLLLLGVLSVAGGSWWMLNGGQQDTGEIGEQHTDSAASATAPGSTAMTQASTALASDDAEEQMVERFPTASAETTEIMERNTGQSSSTAEFPSPQGIQKKIGANLMPEAIAKNDNRIAEESSETVLDEAHFPAESTAPLAADESLGKEGQGETAESATAFPDDSEPSANDEVNTESLTRGTVQTVDYRLATRAGAISWPESAALPAVLLSEASSKRRKRRGSPWAIQADGAYLLVQRELASDSLGGWIDRRLATEEVLEAYSADVSLGYAFHKNWQIRAGLGYTQINTAFSLLETSSRVDTAVGLQTIIFNPDSTVDSIMGPIEIYETTQRRREIYNSFRQWELPILVNYEAAFGRMSLIAEAGARLRFSRSWEGSLLNNSDEVVSLEDQDWYRSGLGLSFQAGLQLGYELSPQWQVRVGGTFRYSPSDFSTEAMPFQERYQLRGLQLGIRYQLR